MDNWIFEILLATIFFILGIFSSDIRNFLKKGSLSLHKRRVEILEANYKYYKNLRENHETLAVESIKLLTNGIKPFVILLLLMSAGILSSVNFFL